MKNKKIFICLILLITSIVISCSWQIPENVKVKTKADYNFGLGNVRTDLTSQLDIPKMIKDQGVELPLGMTIQDYFPGKKDSDTQRYLVKIPIIEMPLDIEQYLEQLDMVTKMDPINIDKVEFTVPDIAIPAFEFPIPVDEVKPYVNVGLKGAGFVNKASVDLYPAKVMESAGVTIGKVTYGPNSFLEIEGQDIKATVESFGGSLPPLPEGAAYEFSPTIPDGRKVTIDFGVDPKDSTKHIEKTSIVKNNIARFDISGMTLDIKNIKVSFDADPYIKLVDKTATQSVSRTASIAQSRGFPDLGGITVPDISLKDLPIPPKVKDIIENPPTAEQIQKNPEAVLKNVDIEGITPDMKPEEIAQKVQAKTPVLVVEGYLANIVESSTLQKLEGFTLRDISDPKKKILPIEAQVPGQEVKNLLPEEYGVIRAEIGEGNINIKMEGIDTPYEITFQTEPFTPEGSTVPEHGLKINPTVITNTDPNLKLNGIKVEKGGFTISGNAKLMLDNTTIVFDPAPKVLITPTLESIASATVDIEKVPGNVGSMLKFNDKFELPKEITQFVNAINLNESGVKITYTNTLPAGNDIKFKAKSDFLNIDRSKEKTDPGYNEKENSVVIIKSGVNNQSTSLYTSGRIEFQEDVQPAVDFNVEVILPKAEGDPDNYVTARNVKAKETYSLEFKLEPKIDWKSIEVNTKNIPIPNETINTNLNLYSQLKGIAEQIGQPDIFSRISLENLPIYIFCSKPDLDILNTMKINAKAKMFFGTVDPNSNNITPIEGSSGYIIGTEASSQTLNFVDTLPTLKTEEFVYKDNNGSYKVNSVITDLGSLQEGQYSLKPDPKELNKVISKLMSTDGSLCIDYDVNITNTVGQESVTINKTDLMNSKNTKISLEAWIDLGLAFTLKGITPEGATTPSEIGMAIDVIQLANLQDSLKEDLLQGQIAELKKQGIDKVMKAIKEISVSYHVNALPLSLDTNKDLAIKIGLNDDIEKTVGLQKGTIGIVNADIDKVLAKEKLIVNKIQVLVPAGTFSIKRAKNVELGLDVKLATDGTIEVMKDGKLTFGGAK